MAAVGLVVVGQSIGGDVLDVDPQNGGKAQVPEGGRNQDPIRLVKLPGQGEHRPAKVPGRRQGLPLFQGGQEIWVDVQGFQGDGLHLRLGAGLPEGGEKGLRQGAGPGVRTPQGHAAVNIEKFHVSPLPIR